MGRSVRIIKFEYGLITSWSFVMIFNSDKGQKKKW